MDRTAIECYDYVLFYEIPFLYFFLHKSWICRTLGNVMDFFLIAIFILLQKNAFGPIFFLISWMGSKVPYLKNWQNGTFELVEIEILLALHVSSLQSPCYQAISRTTFDKRAVKKSFLLQFDQIWRHEVGELMFFWSLGQYTTYQGCLPWGCRGCHDTPRFWQISWPYFNQGGQIMPT